MLSVSRDCDLMRNLSPADIAAISDASRSWRDSQSQAMSAPRAQRRSHTVSRPVPRTAIRGESRIGSCSDWRLTLLRAYWDAFETVLLNSNLVL